MLGVPSLDVSSAQSSWPSDGPDVEHLLDLIEPPAWHAEAACRHHAEVNWFPGAGRSGAAAKRICAGCPVRVECRAAAGDSDSIWGGVSQEDRRSGGEAAPVPVELPQSPSSAASCVAMSCTRGEVPSIPPAMDEDLAALVLAHPGLGRLLARLPEHVRADMIGGG
jgi:hypothetical protein